MPCSDIYGNERFSQMFFFNDVHWFNLIWFDEINDEAFHQRNLNMNIKFYSQHENFKRWTLTIVDKQPWKRKNFKLLTIWIFFFITNNIIIFPQKWRTSVHTSWVQNKLPAIVQYGLVWIFLQKKSFLLAQVQWPVLSSLNNIRAKGIGLLWKVTSP